MIWLNPWAWLGIGTLAVPVLVHLLERNRSRVRRIATLRFLEATPPAASRTARLTDPFLLLVRLLILVVAVAALARPIAPANSAAALEGESPVTRVILVDAGPAMARTTPGGESALEDARRRAREAAGSGTLSGARATPGGPGAGRPARVGHTYIVEVPGSGALLGAAAAGAAAYLAGVPGRREIRVYSVLGTGSLPADALADRLHGIPLVFEQIPLAAPVPDTFVVRHLASETRVSVLAVDHGMNGGAIGDPFGGTLGGVQATWDRQDPPPGAAETLLREGAAYLAAELSGAPAPHPGVPATLVLGDNGLPEGGGAAGWSGIPEGVGDLVLALDRDAALGAAARDTEANTEVGTGRPRGEASPGSSIAIRSARGDVMVLATPVEVNGEPGIHIASATGPDTFLSAALVAAVGRGARDRDEVRVLDPRVHSASEVERWNARFAGFGTEDAGASPERGAGEDRDPTEGSGEARLLWAAVLLLLAAEWRLRVRTRPGGEP